MTDRVQGGQVLLHKTVQKGHPHDHEQHDHECSCGHGHEHGHEHHHDHHDHDHECGCETFSEHALAGRAAMVFTVADLDCPSCAKTCEDAVRSVPGVADAALTYATARLAVSLEPGANPDETGRAIVKAVRACGEDLDLTPEQEERFGVEQSWWDEHRAVVLLGTSGALLAIGLICEFALAAATAALWVYTAAALAGLVFVAPMAFAALGRRTADMNVLMGIAVLGALIMGFYDLAGGTLDLEVFRDAAIVIFLDQVGEWLEGWSMRTTRTSIEGLMDLAPETALVVTSDGTRTEPLADVRPGMLVRVLPGARVPLDGTIVDGDSAFDEAPVTGESVPRDKGVGAEVFGGTLNTVAPVTVKVTSSASDGTLARIVSMVQGAQAEKAPYEGFVDRFAAVYTPAVVGIAAVLGIAVPLVLMLVTGAADWEAWIWRALTLLVIACPCALVISTPVSFVSAITRAARMGVLVKGGACFDKGSLVDAVAFDKTGTLTQGEPQVQGLTVLAEGWSSECVLSVARALECESTHPLAAAVCGAADRAQAPSVAATDVREEPGTGVVGTVDGAQWCVGKPELAVQTPALERAVATNAEKGATSLVLCSRDGDAWHAVAVIAVADAVRTTTADAIAALHRMGIRKTVMLTGDDARVAAAVAQRTGVSDVAARLLPDGKVERVKALEAEGFTVAMVGDGINDAPALAAADLGITMGAASSDTALEVADVALLGGDLEQLPAFFRLSQRTMNVVRENIAFAICVKLAVLVLAAIGLAGMGAAIFADTGVAVLVILNGMRLMTKWETRW